MANTQPRSVSIYPILGVTFVGTLGFSIVLPFLVFLVTRLGGNALVYGVMGATYSAFQLVGAPVLGRWSDRYGRRRILLLSHLGTLTSWAIFLVVALALPVRTLLEVDSAVTGAFTLTIPLVVVFLARALDGLTGGNVSVANAYLADVTDEEHRSANFGKMAVASNLGFIFGPAIAGILGATALGETLPVLAALGISVIAAFLIWLGVPESRPCVLDFDPDPEGVRKMLGQEQKDCYEVEGRGDASFASVLRVPSAPLLLSMYFLVYLAFNFFYIAFPVHAATRLGWSLPGTGAFFSVMGLLMVVVQGPVLGRLTTLVSDRTLIVAGSLILGASFTFFTSPSTATIYGGTALLAVGNGVMWPSLLSTISKAASSEAQGAIQGFASSAGSVASILGLLLGGLLYEYVGSSVFLISTAITALVFLLSLAIRGVPPLAWSGA